MTMHWLMLIWLIGFITLYIGDHQCSRVWLRPNQWVFWLIAMWPVFLLGIVSIFVFLPALLTLVMEPYLAWCQHRGKVKA